ncbi:hypothetical protein GCM10027614_03300 [Micromonospora vulcania]
MLAEAGQNTLTPPPSDLAVDSDRRVLRWRDQEIDLTRLEHDVMLCLVDAPGQVWTYERLHLEVWGNRHLGRGSDMHSVVRRVRRKLARLNAAATIHAVRGSASGSPRPDRHDHRPSGDAAPRCPRIALRRLAAARRAPARLVGDQTGRSCQLTIRRQHRMGDRAKFSTVGDPATIFA